LLPMQGRSRRVRLHEANALPSTTAYSLSKMSLVKKQLAMPVSALFIMCLLFLGSSKVQCFVGGDNFWRADVDKSFEDGGVTRAGQAPPLHFYLLWRVFFFLSKIPLK